MANAPGVFGQFTITQDPKPLMKVGESDLCEVTLVWSESKKNKQTQQWENGPPWYVTGKVWGYDAKKIATESNKGDKLIILRSDFKIDSWKDKQSGEERTKHVLNIQNCYLVKKQQRNNSEEPPSRNEDSQENRPGDEYIPF